MKHKLKILTLHEKLTLISLGYPHNKRRKPPAYQGILTAAL
jgi:hypothetical protein